MFSFTKSISHRTTTSFIPRDIGEKCRLVEQDEGLTQGDGALVTRNEPLLATHTRHMCSCDPGGTHQHSRSVANPVMITRHPGQFYFNELQ